MRNEPKLMEEIHDIRARNYSDKVNLSMQEIVRKRQEETLEVDKIITQYGLKVFPTNQQDRFVV